MHSFMTVIIANSILCQALWERLKLSVEGSPKNRALAHRRTSEATGKGIAVDIFGSGIQDQDREAATPSGLNVLCAPVVITREVGENCWDPGILD